MNSIKNETSPVHKPILRQTLGVFDGIVSPAVFI
jgi:hypothetical protein